VTDPSWNSRSLLFRPRATPRCGAGYLLAYNGDYALDEGNRGEAPIVGHRMDAPRRETPATGLAGMVLLPPRPSDQEVGWTRAAAGAVPARHGRGRPHGVTGIH
jgi:hypothetical protein